MANTPNINLNLPANGSLGWDVPTNANWTTVDSAFGGTSVPKINPAILQVNGSAGLTGITGTGTSVVTNTSPTIATPVISGIVTTYNGSAGVSNGIPYEVSAVNLTGQNTAIGTTNFPNLSSVIAGQYRISWNAKVTTVAGTSSTLGSFSVTYTDPDGVAQTIIAVAQNRLSSMVTTDAGNSTITALWGIPILVNAKSATAIQYSMGYTSNAANAMVYNLNAIVERM